jgi:DNA-binding Xre family transcriptional regulator
MVARFNLAQLLADRETSQRELARRSGVSLVTINRMCANHTTGVSLAVLEKLAAVLGVEPGELIVREKKPRGKK